MKHGSRVFYNLVLFLGRIGFSVCIGSVWAIPAGSLLSLLKVGQRYETNVFEKMLLVVGVLFPAFFFLGWSTFRNKDLLPFLRAFFSLYVPCVPILIIIGGGQLYALAVRFLLRLGIVKNVPGPRVKNKGIESIDFFEKEEDGDVRYDQERIEPGLESIPEADEDTSESEITQEIQGVQKSHGQTEDYTSFISKYVIELLRGKGSTGINGEELRKRGELEGISDLDKKVDALVSAYSDIDPNVTLSMTKRKKVLFLAKFIRIPENVIEMLLDERYGR